MMITSGQDGKKGITIKLIRESLLFLFCCEITPQAGGGGLIKVHPIRVPRDQQMKNFFNNSFFSRTNKLIRNTRVGTAIKTANPVVNRKKDFKILFRICVMSSTARLDFLDYNKLYCREWLSFGAHQGVSIGACSALPLTPVQTNVLRTLFSTSPNHAENFKSSEATWTCILSSLK